MAQAEVFGLLIACGFKPGAAAGVNRKIKFLFINPKKTGTATATAPALSLPQTNMKFRFLWIGKTKDKNWRALQEEYLQRLSHFVKFEITEIRESVAHETKDAEGNRILGNLNQSSFVCLLDVQGLEIKSPQLAERIENWQNRSLKEIVFVICGQDGASSAVVERADYSLSLSRLTLTHEMARVVLIEQLYRAYTIIKGFPYQK